MFERNRNASTHGCSLQLYLPEVTRYQLIQAFGDADSGYVAEEDGYCGTEYTFTSPACESPVYLYFRFDVCRIGALDMQAAHLFVEQMKTEHPELVEQMKTEHPELDWTTT